MAIFGVDHVGVPTFAASGHLSRDFEALSKIKSPCATPRKRFVPPRFACSLSRLYAWVPHARLRRKPDLRFWPRLFSTLPARWLDGLVPHPTFPNPANPFESPFNYRPGHGVVLSSTLAKATCCRPSWSLLPCSRVSRLVVNGGWKTMYIGVALGSCNVGMTVCLG